MGVSPTERLRNLLTNCPPLILFLCSLCFMAIALLTVANYVQLTELHSPASKDWNVFLENFSKLDFCIMSNTSSLPSERPTTASPTQNTSANASSFYSVSMLLTLQPTRDFINVSHSNFTRLSSTIYGKQLGLSGAAAHEVINVTMDVPLTRNVSRCANAYSCDTIRIYTCVYFQASGSVFPTTRSPDNCESVNETSIESSAYMMTGMDTSRGGGDMFVAAGYSCRPLMRVHYKLDPTLTVWLSLRDRSVINLHLLHTSYFLFVMVITVIIYASIRGQASKPKMTAADKIELYLET